MHTTCPECGALLAEGKTCRDYMNQMITWDFEDFLGAGVVHHVTVICFELQHPSLYSKRGLEDAKDFLREIVAKDATFEEHDRRNRAHLSSSVRKWKITGSPEDYGQYANPVKWTIRTPDVAMPGRAGYENRVREWARSVYGILLESGNLS